MSEGAAQPIYSVDTSSFMDWQARYYPADVFSTLNERVSDLVAKGRVLVCRELGIPCISLLGLMRREGWKL